jgi:hypothetical protein
MLRVRASFKDLSVYFLLPFDLSRRNLHGNSGGILENLELNDIF